MITADELYKGLLKSNKITTPIALELFKSLDIDGNVTKNKDEQFTYDECLNLFKAKTKYYEEWTDWAFSVLGKFKSEKLTKGDVITIHMKFSMKVDNNPSTSEDHP